MRNYPLGKRQQSLVNDLTNHPERFVRIVIVFGKSSEITVSDDDLNDYYSIPAEVFDSLVRRKLLKEFSHYGSMEHEVIKYKLCQSTILKYQRSAFRRIRASQRPK